MANDESSRLPIAPAIWMNADRVHHPHPDLDEEVWEWTHWELSVVDAAAKHGQGAFLAQPMNAIKPLPTPHAPDVLWLMRAHESMTDCFPDEALLGDVCSATQGVVDAVRWMRDGA